MIINMIPLALILICNFISITFQQDIVQLRVSNFELLLLSFQF